MQKVSVLMNVPAALGSGFWLYLYFFKEKKIKDAAAIPYACRSELERNFENR
jgi:hypothetical protein